MAYTENHNIRTSKEKVGDLFRDSVAINLDDSDELCDKHINVQNRKYPSPTFDEESDNRAHLKKFQMHYPATLDNYKTEVNF